LIAFARVYVLIDWIFLRQDQAGIHPSIDSHQYLDSTTSLVFTFHCSGWMSFIRIRRSKDDFQLEKSYTPVQIASGRMNKYLARDIKGILA